MWALEWFSPYKYWINTKKQSKKAEKSDIRDKVVDKIVSVEFFFSGKDRKIYDL